MISNEKIQYYVTAFSRLNVNRSGGHPSPHKPVLLLTILELAETGLLPENRIYYNQHLIEVFRSFFQVVQRPGDACNPFLPYFHMRSEPFWHLKARKGKEYVVDALTTASGPSQINENIEYAYLDDDLFEMIHDTQNREILRTGIVKEWFPKDDEVIKTVAAEEKRIVSYEQVLREKAEDKISEDQSVSYEKTTRDSAFSRVVREAYDYRCAASGIRVILPDGSVMVEAAHLIPFSVNQDDDPRNGIALAPNFHWAVDQHILAPGLDLKWHVSSVLDKRNKDFEELIELDKKPVLLPANKKYYPKMDSLEWRMDNIIK